MAREVRAVREADKVLLGLDLSLVSEDRSMGMPKEMLGRTMPSSK